MSRKKQAEHVNHERWLVSYADFITLLFAFFVVLFASSKSDKKKQMELAAVMKTAFSQMSIFEPHSPRPPLTDTHSSTSEDASIPLSLPVPRGSAQEMQQLERLIDEQIRKEIAANSIPPGSVTLRTTPEGLVISLHEAGFFSSGSAEVRPAARGTVIALAHILPARPLRVEGHTDNVPIHTAQYATNWELSTSRAAAIARILLEFGKFHPADLSAAGYAEFHPIVTNSTEAGRSQNRRVDIIELRSSAPLTPPAPAPSQ